MKKVFHPCKLQGTVTAPPSKSETIRLIVVAGLAKGKSEITNVDFSDDVKSALDCVASLGCEVCINSDSVTIDGSRIFEKCDDLNCGESATVLRFMIPLCLADGRKRKIYGSEKLLSRPLDVYGKICSEQNIEFENNGSYITVSGKLRAGEYKIDGSVSSQFASGLLLAFPLLDNVSKLKVNDPFVSRDYVKMTLDAMKCAGVEVMCNGDNGYEVTQCGYKPFTRRIQGDWSNGAFFVALNYLGGNVEIKDLDENSPQPDRICREYFEMLNKENAEISLADCPDLAPVLFAFAGLKNGGHFTDTYRLKYKESNRVLAMKEELSKLGIELIDNGDSVDVKPAETLRVNPELESHTDHRIAMALSVVLLTTGGTLDGCEAVSKSFPNFFDVLSESGAQL